MPTYDYRCAKCGEDMEVFQSFAEAPLTKHKGCGGKLSKVMSPAGIVLKGSGFYKTDNRSSQKNGSKPKDKDKDSTKETTSPSSNGDSSSSKKTETKSETTSTKSTEAKSA